jgi:hypothetical protein
MQLFFESGIASLYVGLWGFPGKTASHYFRT